MKLTRVMTFHRRHYLPLYVFGLALALVSNLFPSVVARVSRDDTASPATAPLAGGPFAADAAPAALAADAAGIASPDADRSAAPRARRAAAPAFRPPPPSAGTTRGGFACSADVRQIPWSIYAPPCTARFAGDNGGATYRGVTKDSIKIVIRRLADDRVADTIVEQLGFGNPKDWDTTRRVFADYFNKRFELYGRSVRLQIYDGRGSTFDELNEKGQDKACIDANEIANDENAFGVIYWNVAGTSGPFSECAARHRLFVPWGAPYFPEGTTTKTPSYFKAWHPYVWTAFPNGESIGHLTAEYIGKRLTGGKAAWAGSAEYRTRTRVFGMLVPRAASYRTIGNLIEQDGRTRWGFTVASRYDYVADPATAGQEMDSAAAQFKNAGVTTVILTSDPAATKLLTAAARAHDWYPEWLVTGIGGADNDATARLYDQAEVDGHMFGIGPMPGAKAYDRKGEARRAWDLAAPGQTPPPFMEINYYFMLDLFTKLQVAGPALTPANIARGLSTHTTGSRADPLGIVSFADDHAALSDAREIYWRGDVTGTDGKTGGFVDTSGGRRYGVGEIPRGTPPIYP